MCLASASVRCCEPTWYTINRGGGVGDKCWSNNDVRYNGIDR